jgi:hypothetical protein
LIVLKQLKHQIWSDADHRNCQPCSSDVDMRFGPVSVEAVQGQTQTARECVVRNILRLIYIASATMRLIGPDRGLRSSFRHLVGLSHSSASCSLYVCPSPEMRRNSPDMSAAASL